MAKPLVFADALRFGHPGTQQPGWTVDDQVRLLAALLRPQIGVRRSREIARRLVQRFGSLPAILATAPRQLSEVDGVGESIVRNLAVVIEVARRLARESIYDDKPFLTCMSQLLDYCRVTMGHEPLEQFRIFFLNKRNRLIADELQQTGTVDHVPVYPREVIKRSLELSATALILVHNHPSGDPAPSSADVRMTGEIIDIASLLGIIVHDHLIIGRSGHVSLRGTGLLDRVARPSTGPSAVSLPEKRSSIFDKLTMRERQVAQLLCQDHALATVAKILKVSCRTAEVHCMRVFEKVGTDSVDILKGLARIHNLNEPRGPLSPP